METVKKEGLSSPVIGGGPIAENKPAVVTASKKISTAKAASAGAMEVFLRPSRTPIVREGRTAEKLADIDENLKNNYIAHDAVEDTDARYALHTILTGGDPQSLVPDNKAEVVVDHNILRQNISGMSGENQIKYGRAMQILDKMKANNFKVMKGGGGVYWMESMENNKRVYASNGILEVAELLDNLSGPSNPDGTPVAPKEVETDPKKLKELITDDPNQELFSTSDKWYLAGMATDLLSSTAGVLGKVATIGTVGAGFMAGVGGTAISVGGGLAALGMSMYGDYLNKEVSGWEMAKNAGIRLGLEAAETVSIMPLSLMNSLKGATTAGKVLRKGIHLYMLKGVVDTAVGTEWMEIMDKDKWETDDYRKMASMAQFMIGSVGGAAANRYSTRKNLTAKTTKANETLETFSEGKYATKDQLMQDKKFGNIDRVTKKYKENVEMKAIEKARVTTELAAKNAAIAKKQGSASVIQAKKTNEAATALAPPIVGTNGQTQIDFNAPAPGPPPINLKATRASIKAKKIAAEKATEVELGVIEKDRLAGITAIDTKKTAGDTKLLARLEKNDKKKIGNDFVAEGVKSKAELDAVYTKAEKEHGSVIAGKLRARAEKRSDVSKEVLEAQKAAKNSKPVIESKLEKFKKEKEALDKKLEKVEADKRTPEDIADIKRVDDAIAAEVKKTKGLRGVGNSIASKSKAGYSASGKGLEALMSAVNTIPSALAVRDEVSSKSLARATVYGDNVDDMTGNRFYKYNLPTAKARLVEEGYSLEEINKYSLNQLRAALHIIEKREKGSKKEEPAPTKLSTKKRPKILRNGGSIRRFSLGGSSLPITPWSIGRFISDYVFDGFGNQTRAVGQRTKARHLAETQAAEKAKAAKIVAKKAADNVMKTQPIIDQKSSGHATNFNIAKTEAEKAAAVEAASEADKPAIAAKFDAIIDAAKKVKLDPVSSNLTLLNNLVSEFKVSDLFGRNRIHLAIPVQEDIKAATYQSLGVRNMPGFSEAMNKTTLIPRVDTADSFAANVMQKEYHNEGEKRRSELIARNAGFIENARAEGILNTNRNLESAVNAENANIQMRNQNELTFASQKVQADAQWQQAESMRKGRLSNAFMSGLSKVYRTKKTEELTGLYNEAASIKSRWNNEFRPRYDAAVASGDTHKVKEIKAEFIQTHQYDPDDLDKQMMDYKTQFRTLGA